MYLQVANLLYQWNGRLSLHIGKNSQRRAVLIQFFHKAAITEWEFRAKKLIIYQFDYEGSSKKLDGLAKGLQLTIPI